MEDFLKIVDYKTYCDKCKYRDIPETDKPCSACLDCPAREGTKKPLKYDPA